MFPGLFSFYGPYTMLGAYRPYLASSRLNRQVLVTNWSQAILDLGQVRGRPSAFASRALAAHKGGPSRRLPRTGRHPPKGAHRLPVAFLQGSPRPHITGAYAGATHRGHVAGIVRSSPRFPAPPGARLGAASRRKEGEGCAGPSQGGVPNGLRRSFFDFFAKVRFFRCLLAHVGAGWGPRRRVFRIDQAPQGRSGSPVLFSGVSWSARTAGHGPAPVVRLRAGPRLAGFAPRRRTFSVKQGHS
jgi:hypothetical protein